MCKSSDSGSAPSSVVAHAIKLFAQDPDYNSVFCVFDRDGHSTFDAAVERIQSTPLTRRRGRHQMGSASFGAITSTPCFEYWLLLHFKYTTMALPRFADVEKQMRTIPQLAKYDKGQQGLFSATCNQLQIALENADRANQAAHTCGTDNPTTRMPELVRYLQQLASRRKP